MDIRFLFHKLRFIKREHTDLALFIMEGVERNERSVAVKAIMKVASCIGGSSFRRINLQYFLAPSKLEIVKINTSVRLVRLGISVPDKAAPVGVINTVYIVMIYTFVV